MEGTAGGDADAYRPDAAPLPTKAASRARPRHRGRAPRVGGRVRDRRVGGACARQRIGVARTAALDRRHARSRRQPLWPWRFASFPRPPPPPPPETRLEIDTPATTDPISFALSPDGRQIVFVASGDGASRLWLRSLASTTAQPLAGTEGAAYPFWSPDSRSVGFFADGRLKRLDIGGGAPQTLATVSTPRRNLERGRRHSVCARSLQARCSALPASGGEAVAVTTLDRQASHRFPFFLPDGRQFLFFARGTPETAGIYLGSLDSADTKRLTPADTAGVYLPGSEGMEGWLAWVRDGTLVAQRLDLEQKALTGDPVTVADPVAFDATQCKRRIGRGNGPGGLPGGRRQPAATGLVRPVRQGAGRDGRAG